MYEYHVQLAAMTTEDLGLAFVVFAVFYGLIWAIVWAIWKGPDE